MAKNCCGFANLLNKKLKLKEIHDTILRRSMPFVPNLYQLLGMTKEEGMLNFADIILEAKNIFETYNPRVAELYLDDCPSCTPGTCCFDGNQIFAFKDNFQDYLDEKIPASEVSFKPAAIIDAAIAMGGEPEFITANNFGYDSLTGVFKSIYSGSLRLRVFLDYPFHAEIADDKEWTENSAVYLIDVGNHRDMFLTLCSLQVLMRIREYSNMVQLPGFTANIQLNDTIARLEQQVAIDRTRCSVLYTKWGNFR